MTDSELRLLLKSFIRSLDTFQAALDKHTDAISDANCRYERTQQPAPQIIINPIIGLPPGVEAYYRSEQEERPSNKRRERIKRAAEFVALGIALILAGLTYLTLRQVTRQADASFRQIDDFEKSQRAILTVEVDISQDQSELTFIVKNVGSGAATDINTPIDPGYSHSNLTGDPDARDLEAVLKPAPPAETGLYMGPKDERRFNVSLPSTAEIIRLPVGQRDPFFYINVGYHDTFGSAWHTYGCASWNWKHRQFRPCYVPHYGDRSNANSQKEIENK